MKHQKDNIDEIDQLLYDYFENKEVPKETTERIKNTINTLKPTKKFVFFKAVATVCTVFLLTTGVVFAEDIVKFIGEIFNLTSINLNNTSVVDAIKNKEYIQNVDMDYITINDDYKIKIDYLMVDDINLYMVFNIYSKNNIPTNYRFSILDLIITDENDNCLYDSHMQLSTHDFLATAGFKNIDTITNEIRELFFMISNGIPNIESLNIKFTKLTLYDKNNPNKEFNDIETNCNFKIELIDKFKNREIINYTTTTHINNEYEIQKCIANDTGLYLLYKTKTPSINFKFSNDNITYKKNHLGITDNNEFLFITQFHISKEELQKTNSFEIINSNNEKIIFTKTY